MSDASINSLYKDFNKIYSEELYQDNKDILKVRKQQLLDAKTNGATTRVLDRSQPLRNDTRAKVFKDKGDECLEDGKYEPALKMYKFGLMAKPTDDQLLSALISSIIKTYTKREDFSGLTKEIKTLLITNPDQSSSIAMQYYCIIYFYQAAGEYETAQFLAVEGSKMDFEPDLKAGFFEILARIYLIKKEYDAATSAAALGLAQNPTIHKVFLELQKAYFAGLTKQTDPNVLLTKIESVLEKKQNANSLKALFPNDIFNPKNYLKNGVDENNFFAFLCVKISQILLLESKCAKAIQIATIGLGEKKINTETTINLYERIVHAHFFEKNYKKALEILQFCLDLSPQASTVERLMYLRKKIQKDQKKSG